MSKKYKFRKRFTIEGVRYDVKADTKAELIEKEMKKRQEIEEGSKLVRSTMLMNQWIDYCLNEYCQNNKAITIQGKRERVSRWIRPYIGNMPVKKVRAINCQKILSDMADMSSDSIRKVRQLLYFFFDMAIVNNLIRINPVDGTIPPKGKAPIKRRQITEYERKHIMKVADEEDNFKYFLTMLLCGLRPSEASRIRSCDIKETEMGHVLYVRGSKTKNATRVVPVPSYLFERLPLDYTKPFDLIFKNKRGEELSKSNRDKLWKHFKNRLNISMGCSTYRNQVVPPFRVAPDLLPYCLRHSYCCDLAKANVDIRVASKLMGHSSIRLTSDVYHHVDEEDINDALEKLDNYTQKGENIGEIKPRAIAIAE